MTKKTIMKKVAEKSIAATAVSSIAGGFMGACATKLTTDIIENVVPAPVSIGMKITYGIGSYAIGGIVGVKVADYITDEMMDMSGVILTAKATFRHSLKVVNADGTEE